MEFLTFEDETDMIETTFFPEVYRRFCHMLDWGRPYLLSGRVETDWGALTLTVDEVAPLPPLQSMVGFRAGLHKRTETPKLIHQTGGSGTTGPGTDLSAARP
jgi:DNA polymerase III alpha subunit